MLRLKKYEHFILWPESNEIKETSLVGFKLKYLPKFVGFFEIKELGDISSISIGITALPFFLRNIFLMLWLRLTQGYYLAALEKGGVEFNNLIFLF